ncbi:MAG: septum formation initiator family protein [Schleiferiaceae bacterium]|jgi:cell division protein FtsB|nr:septum formation initiator family protein [Schleiferiaceae bacterium]
MTLKAKIDQLNDNVWFRILKNRYVLGLLGFSIWMLFIDTNSWIIQRELTQDLKKLNNEKAFFEAEIKANKEAIQELTGSEEKLEKYARERHYMVKENEELFIVDVGE